MYLNELKCIEVLIRSLISRRDLSKEIKLEFEDPSTFEDAKANLFNMITINNLIKNFNENMPFSLSSFLYYGAIPGITVDRVETPIIDSRYAHNPRAYYEYLIEALKEGNYTFDENHNIYVSSEHLTSTIPESWLYRLSTICKKSQFEQIYFYNKVPENSIMDKNDLIDYLRRTKTFLVNLTSNDESVDLETTFKNIREKTNREVKRNGEVKVDDIISSFKNNTPPNCITSISKYKLSDVFFLVSRAEKMGEKFYGEPLSYQRSCLNKWMIDYINSNSLANRDTQLFLFLYNTDGLYNESISKLSRRNIIAGLFSLYVSILKSLEIDFSNISLSNFKIEKYVSEAGEQNLIALSNLIKKISKHASSKELLRKELNYALTNLNVFSPDESQTDYKERKERYESLLEDYCLIDRIENELMIERNQLQGLINEEQENSTSRIAFDNDAIMNLMYKATQSGRIYLNYRENKLIIEIYNDELGKVIFKSTISLEKLLYIIEDTNYTISENLHLKVN